VPLAIGLIAAMFGAFAAAKIQAFKLAGSQKFAEGGEVDGESHASGGNKYRSIDGRSKVIEIEAGEWITKKKQTRKYKGLLKAINNDELSNMNFGDLMSMVDPTGSRLKEGSQEKVIELHKEASQVNILSLDPIISEKLQSMDKRLEELVAVNKGKDFSQDMGDYILEKKGSVTRKIKK